MYIIMHGTCINLTAVAHYSMPKCMILHAHVCVCAVCVLFVCVCCVWVCVRVCVGVCVGALDGEPPRSAAQTR